MRQLEGALNRVPSHFYRSGMFCIYIHVLNRIGMGEWVSFRAARALVSCSENLC